jgi:hypothetical protein
MAADVCHREALTGSQGNLELGRVDGGYQLDLAIVGNARAVVFG